MEIRLQKWLAAQGVGSRRAVEKMIASGRIEVDGVKIIKQGVKIDPVKQAVRVDGKIVKQQPQLEYYLVNKPRGIVSASKSQDGTPVVTDLVSSSKRLFPVGRLDKDSQGLIILTNDGELTHRLTHPKYHLPKTYIVRVRGKISQKAIDKLSGGIELSEGMTAPAQVAKSGKHELTITIHEGKYRQIRRMCQAVDLTVEELTRTRVAHLVLGDLAAGAFRGLTAGEAAGLRAAVGLV